MRWCLLLALLGQYCLSAQTVARFDVFAQTLRPPALSYTNPWKDVTVDVELISPSARRINIGGFYHSPGAWMFRFAPDEPGAWSWTAQLRAAEGVFTWNGTLTVTDGRNPGFIKTDPRNSFRWAHSNGAPFYPIGINDCVFNRRADSNDIDPDGPIRFWMDQRIVEKEEYFHAYGTAGINLFRWGPENCSVPLFDTLAPEGNVYLEDNARRIDDMLYAARRAGLRVYQVLFGARLPYTNNPTEAELAAVRRYVKYMVDRYGALVDIWELMNESLVDESWYDAVAAHLHAIDPYRHPVSTSHERPELKAIEINSPHWYENEDEFASDAVTWKRIQNWKQAGKPVIVGEQGNQLANWDASSSLRLRLRLWTAFFADGALTLWNSSRFKPAPPVEGLPANIYLGAEERAQIRVLRDFVNRLDAGALPCPVFVISPAIRSYALCGPHDFGAYFHYHQSHDELATGFDVFAAIPVPGTVEWVLPETGQILGSEKVTGGLQWLRIPNFRRDVALQFLPEDGR